MILSTPKFKKIIVTAAPGTFFSSLNRSTGTLLLPETGCRVEAWHDEA